MKTYTYKMFLFICLVDSVRVSAANVQQASPLPKAQLVLRLPFRPSVAKSPQSKIAQKLTTLGQFESGVEIPDLFYGQMLTTDAKGHLYFFDPINPKTAFLREVDRQGHEIEQWPLRTANSSYQAITTSDGFVWLDIAQNSIENNFPVVAYKKGQKAPILDWRKKPPFDITRFLQITLGKEQFEVLTPQAKEGLYKWQAQVSRGKNGQVRIYLSNSNGGYYQTPKLRVRLTMSSDGKRLLKRETISEKWQRIATPVSPDGTQWYIAKDSKVDLWKWNNIWLWKQGQPKGKPLLNLQQLLQPDSLWQKTLGLQKSELNPGVYVDGRNNIYIEFTRAKPKDDSKGELAMVVLDAKRQVLGFLPWSNLYMRSGKSFFLLSDGSGFYRQEEDEKELRIYFHTLPRPKQGKSQR